MSAVCISERTTVYSAHIQPHSTYKPTKYATIFKSFDAAINATYRTAFIAAFLGTNC